MQVNQYLESNAISIMSITRQESQLLTEFLQDKGNDYDEHTVPEFLDRIRTGLPADPPYRTTIAMVQPLSTPYHDVGIFLPY